MIVPTHTSLDSPPRGYESSYCTSSSRLSVCMCVHARACMCVLVRIEPRPLCVNREVLYQWTVPKIFILLWVRISLKCPGWPWADNSCIPASRVAGTAAVSTKPFQICSTVSSKAECLSFYDIQPADKNPHGLQKTHARMFIAGFSKISHCWKRCKNPTVTE